MIPLATVTFDLEETEVNVDQEIPHDDIIQFALSASFNDVVLNISRNFGTIR